MSKKTLTNAMNIFELKGIRNSNLARIKKLGYIVHNEDKFEDVVLEIDDKKTTSLEIMNDVHVRFLRCRIPDTILSTQKKLPLIYASLMYEKKFLTGFLFNVFVYFEITTDTSKIKSMQQLLNMELEGKYTIEIVMDDKVETINIDNYVGEKDMIVKLLGILKSDDMKNVINLELEKRAKDRRERFGNLVADKPIKPTINLKEYIKRYQNGEDIDEIVNL